mmetsp:Transcript_32651/g.60335  ORF Transcript_32651/g.60335 Transcript_32651/m.60335 type:complete len:262 (-) Transcript_32651:786-1571(-)
MMHGIAIADILGFQNTPLSCPVNNALMDGVWSNLTAWNIRESVIQNGLSYHDLHVRNDIAIINTVCTPSEVWVHAIKCFDRLEDGTTGIVHYTSMVTTLSKQSGNFIHPTLDVIDDVIFDDNVARSDTIVIVLEGFALSTNSWAPSMDYKSIARAIYDIEWVVEQVIFFWVSGLVDQSITQNNILIHVADGRDQFVVNIFSRSQFAFSALGIIQLHFVSLFLQVLSIWTKETSRTEQTNNRNIMAILHNITVRDFQRVNIV